MEKKHLFPDQNQNFWELTSIQAASQSIPGFLIGGILTKQYGPAAAFSSICIGNLILWLIGICVVSMSIKEKYNAVENVKGYLGKTGSLLMGVFLILAFLTWYVLEIQAATATLFQKQTGNQSLIWGTSFGIFTAFMAIGGIRLIKWVCVFAFPLILCFILYTTATSESFSLISMDEFSIPAIFTVITLTLPGTVNLPTFFRHSNSKADSFIALTLITLFYVLFQACSIFSQTTEPSQIINTTKISPIISMIFILTSLICLNLVNIYFASACFELIAPWLSNRRGYLLAGLLGSVAYFIWGNSGSLESLEIAVDNFIANLGIVLLISYLIKIIVSHRPRTFEKLVNSGCWIFGCFLAVIMQIKNPQDSNGALFTGICGSIIAYLGVVFFEETAWAIKKVS